MSVTQQLTRGCTRALVLAKGLDPVHDDRAIAFGTLYAPPFAAREIVRDFAGPFRLNIKTIEVVDDHVGPRTFTQHTAVTEARGMRRQRRHPVVRLFQRHLLLIAHQPSQEVSGERAGRQKLRMCAAIRYSWE